MHIRQAAAHLNVSIDMLRHWERNGLLTVSRDPTNQYRLYRSTELGRLRVIRMLVKSGFSLVAILRMLQQADSGNIRNLREALSILTLTRFWGVGEEKSGIVDPGGFHGQNTTNLYERIQARGCFSI
jgi:DNA-binding transcriptional MerR regulator